MFEKFSNSFLRDFDFDQLIDRFENKVFKTFHKGEYIFKRGDIPANVYFILSGKVRICNSTAGRNIECINILSEGDILGIDDAIRNEKYLYTAETDCDTNIMIISKNEIISLNKENHEFNIWLLKYLSSRISKHE